MENQVNLVENLENIILELRWLEIDKFEGFVIAPFLSNYSDIDIHSIYMSLESEYQKDGYLNRNRVLLAKADEFENVMIDFYNKIDIKSNPLRRNLSDKIGRYLYQIKKVKHRIKTYLDNCNYNQGNSSVEYINNDNNIFDRNTATNRIVLKDLFIDQNKYNEVISKLVANNHILERDNSLIFIPRRRGTKYEPEALRRALSYMDLLNNVELNDSQIIQMFSNTFSNYTTTERTLRSSSINNCAIYYRSILS